MFNGKKTIGTHRVAWTIAFGDPGNLHVLHRCDTPACCEPACLFLGTNDDNVADRKSKGRQFHKLSLADLSEIRREYAEGVKSQGLLAKEFGVDRSVISRVVNRKRGYA